MGTAESQELDQIHNQNKQGEESKADAAQQDLTPEELRHDLGQDVLDLTKEPGNILLHKLDTVVRRLRSKRTCNARSEQRRVGVYCLHFPLYHWEVAELVQQLYFSHRNLSVRFPHEIYFITYFSSYKKRPDSPRCRTSL